MQAYLMNFGDNTRVVNDSHNAAVSIGIGEVKECDIHDVHFHMIRRAVAKETLLVVPKEVKQSERLGAIMTLMQELMTESYDDVLAKYNLLDAEDEDAPRLRPTRDQMRLTLRDLARQEVASALKLQSKVNIREQGDEVTRQPVTPRPAPEVIKPPPQPEPKKVESPDRKDRAPRKAASKRSDPPPPPVPKSKVKRERL